jgi:hypothetical protein
MTQPSLSIEAIDGRITFHSDAEIMEVSFEDVRFESSSDANIFYDRLEQRIAESGEELWFFLVNYRNTWIDPSAWFAFSRRGKELNEAHSMASVRFDASEITKKQIERSAGTENFDPSLFFDRESAMARLKSLPSKRKKFNLMRPKLSFTRNQLNWRLEFMPDQVIMSVDFSDMSFEGSDDVNFVYDFVEEQVTATARKWYFLVNYNGTRIQSPAWVQYAARGKALNEACSLGSVRYATGSETETDIRLRAESQDFRPNIRNTKDEAIARIGEMKAEAVDA